MMLMLYSPNLLKMPKSIMSPAPHCTTLLLPTYEGHENKLASLEATLVRNYDRLTDWLTDGGEV